MSSTAHLYEIFIKASPETVWDALLDADTTRRYFHDTSFESDWNPGSAYRNVLPDGTVAVEGTVEVFEPPERLVITWHVLYDAALAEEPAGRVEWRLVAANDERSITRVTLRHGDLGLSPRTWAHVRLGWVEIVDGLKTLLETGAPLGPVDTSDEVEADDAEGAWHRIQAVAANNAAWELLDGRVLGADEADELLDRAHAARYHWERAAGRAPINAARATWLVSRAHAVLGHGELALHHADRCLEITVAAGREDFDLAYAHEARARALACLGRRDEARRALDTAIDVPVADREDREIVEADLASEPWFGLPISSSR